MLTTLGIWLVVGLTISIVGLIGLSFWFYKIIIKKKSQKKELILNKTKTGIGKYSSALLIYFVIFLIFFMSLVFLFCIANLASGTGIS